MHDFSLRKVYRLDVNVARKTGDIIGNALDWQNAQMRDF